MFCTATNARPNVPDTVAIRKCHSALLQLSFHSNISTGMKNVTGKELQDLGQLTYLYTGAVFFFDVFNTLQSSKDKSGCVWKTLFLCRGLKDTLITHKATDVCTKKRKRRRSSFYVFNTESSRLMTSKSTKIAVEWANITANHLWFLNQGHCDPQVSKT